MQTHELTAHPVSPPLAVSRVAVRARLLGRWVQMRWRVEGSAKLVLPPFTGRQRRDGLWRTTCFEMFAQTRGQAGYAEYNLSPSEAWAAYDFSGPREGMAERALSHDPVLTPRFTRGILVFDAAIPLADLPAQPLALGLTAVLEEEGGVHSYWAVKHGDPAKPDFHDPACFALRLEPPAGP